MPRRPPTGPACCTPGPVRPAVRSGWCRAGPRPSRCSPGGPESGSSDAATVWRCRAGMAQSTPRAAVALPLLSEPVTRSIRLRPWQKAAFEKYVAAGQADFLTVATPGAGKTTFALTVARHVLSERPRARLIVVAPTAHL